MYTPGTRIGNYVVVSELGIGGMGAVFRARHAVLGQDVALKVLLPHLARRDKVRARFVREAQVQFNLHHPHIVSVTDFIEQPDFAALIMDFVPGPSLQAWLDGHAASGMPWTEAQSLVLPVIDALAFAHSQGVVHRDVKPDNVLLDQRGGTPGVARVTDFGLAKVLATSDALTKTGARMGSYPYMAPEQFQGARDLDARADVFALGVLVYRVLSGRLPVDPENQGALWGWYMGKQPADGLAAVAPGVPTGLAAAVDSAMSIERSARPVDAAGLLRLLRGAGAGVGAAGRAPARRQAPAPTVLESVAPPRTAPVMAGSSSRAAAQSPRRMDGGQVELWLADTPAPKPSEASDAKDAARGPSRWQVAWLSALVALALAFVVAALIVTGIVPVRMFDKRPDASPARSVADAVMPDEARPAADEEASNQAAKERAGEEGRAAPRAAAERIATRKKEETRKTALSSADKGGMEWVRIAGGTFSMGSDDGDSDEKPVHPVTVSSFEMAKSEVTVGQYGACVRAGKCTAPDTGEYCNWGKTGRTNHPVNCVEWSQAVAFSRWVGGRLPTEAEWEYAARSGGRSWRYPWGSSPVPDCRGVVMDDERTRGSAGSETDGCGHDRTWPVCSKSAGHSRQGLCDMLGNVWEWTGDWYGSYDSDASRDPKGATGGSHRVLRGCSWSNAAGGCRAANRFRDTPSRRGSYLGFRPSRSVP